jgi:hypothetical protein
MSSTREMVARRDMSVGNDFEVVDDTSSVSRGGNKVGIC